MTRAVLIAAAAGFLLSGAFIAGRRSAPTRVETRTEYRDRVVTVQAQQQATQHEEAHAGHTTTVTRTVFRTGPVQERTVYVQAGRQDTARDAAASATVTAQERVVERVQERTVVAPLPRWAVGASAGWAPALRMPGVPARLSVDGAVRVLGNLWVTAGASASPSLSSPVMSLGLRMEF